VVDARAEVERGWFEGVFGGEGECELEFGALRTLVSMRVSMRAQRVVVKSNIEILRRGEKKKGKQTT